MMMIILSFYYNIIRMLLSLIHTAYASFKMLILTHFQKSIYRFFKATKALITSTELAFL